MCLPAEIVQFRRYLKRRQCAANTVENYVRDLELFFGEVPKAVGEVKPPDVNAFIERQQELGRTVATINRRIATLRAFYEFVRENEQPKLVSPVRRSHFLRRPRPLPRPLKEGEVRVFFESLEGERDRAMFGLMLRTGLRVEEVASLQMRDVELFEQTVMVCASKNGKDRLVYLSDDGHRLLESYLERRREESCEKVFLVERGRCRGEGISVRGIQKRIEYYGKKTGVAISCHRLRHTFATQLLDAGADLVVIQELLGHSSVTTTRRYTKLADRRVRSEYFEGIAAVIRNEQRAE